MRILALDIGRRRTGAAFAESDVGVPMVIDTIRHQSVEDLLAHVRSIITGRGIDHIVVGLPLLPSGIEGEQAEFVRSVVEQLQQPDLLVEFLDERYTTQESGETDGDARAACELLQTFLKRS